MAIEAPPSWLPELVLLENSNGNWASYLDLIHHHFYHDFVVTRPTYRNFPVFTRYHPATENKGATFWHIVTEGKIEEERVPSIRRCERIRWPKEMILKADSSEVKSWETIRPWKNQLQRRINFSTADFDYLVVIAERNAGFDLVTAYYIEENGRRKKLEREWKDSHK